MFFYVTLPGDTEIMSYMALIFIWTAQSKPKQVFPIS